MLFRKNRARLSLLVTLLAITATSSFAGEGSERGGGDNLPGEAGSAWFLGGDAVHYCIAVAPDFGATQDVVEKEIAASLAHWAKYVQVKGVNANRSNESAPLTIATQFVRDSVCDGTQPLAFYLGLSSPEIEKAKAGFYNPTAFANRSSYDLKRGWGRGFVWVAKANAISQYFPNWTQPYALTGTLMHEIGHVFGNGHIQGTVMRSDFSDLLGYGDKSDQVKNWATHIDGYTELYANENKASDGAIAVDALESADTFKKFTGRAAVGAIHAQFTLRPSIKLVLTDSIGTVELSILTSPDDDSAYSRTESIDTQIFRVSREGTGAVQRHFEAGSGSIQIRTAQGKLTMVNIEYNLQNNKADSPTVLWYFDQGKRKMLFHQAVQL